MKTANELAQEYFAKTPMERLHTTLQDYVYDYQQRKINDVLQYLDEKCGSRFDFDVEVIRELLS